jgi:type IV secretion system protein VirD4
VLVICATAPEIAVYPQGDSSNVSREAQRRAAIQAGVFVAGEEQRLTSYRNQKNPNPELLAKGEKETAALVARMHAKWAATPYLKLYQTALQKTLDDPTFRDRAVQELERPAWWNPFSSSPPATLAAQEDAVDHFFKTWTMPILGLLLAGGLAFGWYLEKTGWKSSKKPYFSLPPPPPQDTYGSAEWEEVHGGLPDQLAAFNGVFFGKSSAPIPAHLGPFEEHHGAPIFSTPENHTLIVAQTRTGKGARVVIPTLLRYFNGSALVIDPKGENAAVTARTRMNPAPGVPGQTVHIINPWGELAPTFQQLGLTPFATYNPLDILDRNDPNAVSIAQDLAAAICPTEKGGKEAFWVQSAASILTAVLLWLADQPGETKTLGRAREIVTGMNFRKDYLTSMAASSAFGGAIAENAGPFVNMAQETYSGVMGNLAQHTSFLSDPRIKAATGTSSFSMGDLPRKVTTVYLVIPPEKMKTQRTWLRLLISAGMQTYKRSGLKKPLRCMFLIDEFAALGKLEEMPRDISTMAGYGVDFTLVVQDFKQLKTAYGDAAATIINNCAYKWFCNLDDLESAEYLSKTLGNKTVQTRGQGTSTNFNPGGGSSGTSTTLGQTGRPLLMPDEILNLGRDTAILLAPGTKPQYLRPIDYWRLTEAFANMREFYPHMYWDPIPLKWDENPLPHD